MTLNFGGEDETPNGGEAVCLSLQLNQARAPG
jgi:hypothetical protein